MGLESLKSYARGFEAHKTTVAIEGCNVVKLEDEGLSTLASLLVTDVRTVFAK